MAVAALATIAIGGVTIALLARRAGREASTARAGLLDLCAPMFDQAPATRAPDGFPRLSGVSGGRRMQVALVPDTLTLKRLPQLWLVIGLPVDLDGGGLVVTARPRGDDFISRARDMRWQLDVPPWLPEDCAVSGDDARAGILLAALRLPLELAFADHRLKEISIGQRGLRLVYQGGEGARGAHLLMRQARFTEPVAAQTLERCRAILFDMEAALVSRSWGAA